MNEQINPYSKRFRYLFNKYFDYRSWIDLNRTKAISYYFLNIFRKFFIPEKVNKENIKSFDEVVKEMGLTEEDIAKRSITFKRMYRLMIIASLMFYVYSLYQLLYGGILSVMISVVIAFVCLTLAFRYHFWYFQIKKHKLGCSIKEWFKSSFMDGGQ